MQAAREKQYARYRKEICNCSVLFEQLMANSPLTAEQQQNSQILSIKEGMNNRVQIKIIRLARTITDLEGEDSVVMDS